MDFGCTLRDVWSDVRDATIRILEETTFADLAARAGGEWTRIAAPTLAPSSAEQN
jgi:DNA-binding IscR family transcriptional regulator